LPGKRAAGEAALRLMDEHLADRRYFVGDRLSLADIGLYAYTHVAESGGFELGGYPSVQAWLGRVAAEPGHIAMDA
jgi:glutathione S-transferase